MNRIDCKECPYFLSNDIKGIAMDYCTYPKHKMKLSYVGTCEKYENDDV